MPRVTQRKTARWLRATEATIADMRGHVHTATGSRLQRLTDTLVYLKKAHAELAAFDRAEQRRKDRATVEGTSSDSRHDQ